MDRSIHQPAERHTISCFAFSSADSWRPVDHDALRDSIRLAITAFVTIAVPAGNYVMYRPRHRAAR
jgi:hypothetical protein